MQVSTGKRAGGQRVSAELPESGPRALPETQSGRERHPATSVGPLPGAHRRRDARPRFWRPRYRGRVLHLRCSPGLRRSSPGYDALREEVLHWSLDDVLALTVSLVKRVDQIPATRLTPVVLPHVSPLIPAFGLTPREMEILGYLVNHHSDREIAESLFISPRTVGTHIASIRSKLGVSSRREAARIAEELGLG